MAKLTKDDAAAIAKMSEKQAAVLGFAEAGKSMVEIADIIGAPIGTVKSRLHRARARIRAARNPINSKVTP